MKLRIGEYPALEVISERSRLVGQGKEVEESTSFPGGGKLQYVLRQSPAKTSVVKTNEGDKSCINVIVDQNKAKEWAESEKWDCLVLNLFFGDPRVVD